MFELDRYVSKRMAEHWSLLAKLGRWLRVELVELEARVELGRLRPEVCEAIKAHAKIDPVRMKEFEKDLGHDMKAFVKDVRTSLKEAGLSEEYLAALHEFTTSYDIEDPALVLALRQTLAWVVEELTRLEAELRHKAREHKWTLLMGRTHGQDAQPTTFGHILLVYANAVRRSIGRIERVLKHELAEAKMSGAIGNYAEMDPAVEAKALAKLGLSPAEAETQILQRDRFAAVVGALAVASGTLQQIAQTLWLMAGSDRHEIEEPRGKNQIGSSAMAHKKNPIRLERAQGLPRVVQALSVCSLQNIATPDFRAIEQSSVERVVYPFVTSFTEFLAKELTVIVSGMTIFVDQMAWRVNQGSFGVWASQRIRNDLVARGVHTEVAEYYVQRCGFESVRQQKQMLEVLRELPLSASEKPGSENDARTGAEILIDSLELYFDPRNYIERGVHQMFGVESPQLSLGVASEPSPQPV